MAHIETDYLVVGTGGTAMAFVDTLLSESDAKVVMVDRHHRPGGHWNDAYPFVKLHQPSPWYGVASRELSTWTRETSGLNAGMISLSSGPEVLAHFDQAMQQRFLPSGRVKWFPKCDHVAGDGRTHRVRSLMSGEEHTVTVRRKLVNATHAKTEVPSTHPPKYTVMPGMQCVPLNELPKASRPYAKYTVVGSGKTGMDACLWLVENGVPHERIRWVMPRDAWMMDRANFQPGPTGYERYFHNAIVQFDAMAQATDLRDLFRRLEEGGTLMRIDPDVEPSTYRCAVVSRGEMEQLRKIGQAGEIVRMGHVRALEPSRLVLDKGSLPAEADTLYVDCTAGAIQPTPPVPIFEDHTINLLMVRWCQPLFSAAVIAWVESHVADIREQNALCLPVKGPELPIDFLLMWLPTLVNTDRWRQNPDLSAWLSRCRLNGQAVVLKDVQMTPAVQDFLKQVGGKAAMAASRLPQLIAQVNQ